MVRKWSLLRRLRRFRPLPGRFFLQRRRRLGRESAALSVCCYSSSCCWNYWSCCCSCLGCKPAPRTAAAPLPTNLNEVSFRASFRVAQTVSLQHRKLTACVTALSSGRERTRERAKHFASIARAEQVFAGPFGVGHQSQNISLTITNTRDVVAGTIRVRCVS